LINAGKDNTKNKMTLIKGKRQWDVEFFMANPMLVFGNWPSMHCSAADAAQLAAMSVGCSNKKLLHKQQFFNVHLQRLF